MRFRKYTFISIALAIVTFAVCFPQAATAGEYRPAIATHRGASGYLPEHTMAAKAMAYALDVDYIEPDVVLTKDFIPIVRHDTYLASASSSTTDAHEFFGVTGTVQAADYTWEQIQQLTAFQTTNTPNRFPLEYNGLIRFRVHKLEEELLLLQGLNKSTGKNIGTYVETKGNADYNITPTIEMLKKYGYNHPDAKVILQSFQLEHLQKARDELGWVGPTCYLTDPSAAQLTQYGGWEGIAKYADIWSPTLTALRVSASDYTRPNDKVTAAREAGIRIHCYTHNNTATGGIAGLTQEQTFDFLFKIVKVDGMFTDFADHVIEYLIRNGMREPSPQYDGYYAYQAPTKNDGAYRPAVAAHRGASGYLPQHTLEAKAMAYGLGADYIEPDVVLTRDGVPIVLHDLTLEATTNVADVFSTRRARFENGSYRYYAIDLDWAEIKRLTVTEPMNRQTGNQTFPGRFPAENGIGFRVHTLEEEILLVKGLNTSTNSQASPLFAYKEVGIYPEIKEPAFHTREGKPIEAPVIEMLTKYGYNEPDAPVILQSFELDSLKRARELGWVAPVAMLPSTQDLLSKAGIEEIAKYADIYAPAIDNLLDMTDYGWTPNPCVKWARDAGMKVHTWTYRTDALGLQGRFTEEELLDALFKVIKVDGLFTDFTDVVVKYLYDNNMRGAAALPGANYYVVSARSADGANGVVNFIDATPTSYGNCVVFEENAIVKLSAKPIAGFHFEGWFENDAKVPNAGATYTFNASENRMLEARFISSGELIDDILGGCNATGIAGTLILLSGLWIARFGKKRG